MRINCHGLSLFTSKYFCGLFYDKINNPRILKNALNLYKCIRYIRKSRSINIIIFKYQLKLCSSFCFGLVCLDCTTVLVNLLA